MCCSGLCCCSSGAGTWHMNLNWGCWSKCLQTHWEALFNASFSTQGLGREASSALLLLAAQSAYHFHLYLSPVPWRVNNLSLHHFSASPTWGRFSAEDLRMEFTWSRHIGTDLHTWQLSAGIWICSNKPQFLECPAKVSSRIPLCWFPVSWVLFTVLKSIGC